MQNIPQAPCKGCNDRKQGCHGKCKAYLEYNKIMEQIRYERFKRNCEYGQQQRYMKETKKRMAKGKRKER